MAGQFKSLEMIKPPGERKKVKKGKAIPVTGREDP
jgi:hypothetical protein